MPDKRPISFRRYIITRQYHHGRGSRAGWAFVVYALGDEDLPNASTWGDLRGYLVKRGVEQAMLQAAYIVWRSYLARVSMLRRVGGMHLLGQATGITAPTAMTLAAIPAA